MINWNNIKEIIMIKRRWENEILIFCIVWIWVKRPKFDNVEVNNNKFHVSKQSISTYK